MRRLQSNVGFPYTSNGLIFLRRKGAVVRRCFYKLVFLIISKFSQETPALVFSYEISQIFNNIFFVEELRWLLLKTVINCNAKYFERRAVLRGGGMIPGGAWFRSIWKTELLG